MSLKDHYASLGMYDFPALRAAQDAWWVGLAGYLRKHGFDNVPGLLNRAATDPYDIWLSPNLLFSQTCGYPLTHRLAGKVQLIGTPCYDAPGCQGALYRSVFIVGADWGDKGLAAALRGRVALNAWDSYSGWRVLSDLVDRSSTLVISGSHAKSIDFVREGKADLAAIDCVTHALIGDVEPERLAGTCVIDQSQPAPGLPYITRADMNEAEVQAMTKATQNAFADPELAVARKTLRLAGFEHVPASQYKRVMAPESAP